MARLAIRMPKMSMTMTEGEVSLWLVAVGDEVAEGDAVCEVMTDKIDMEVESTVSGTLVEILVEEGMVDVGAPIAWVEGEDTGGGFGDLLSAPTDDAPNEAPNDVPGAEEHPGAPSTPSPTAAGPVAAVPRARSLAREHGIDLADVRGSGPEGLVRVADVEALTARPVPAASAPAPTSAPAPSRDRDRRTAVRRVVARTMGPSALVPQFTVWREVRLDTADAVRDGVSWTTLLLRAYAASLREVPELLSRWEEDRPSEAGPPAVALAVATDRGLLVPTFVEPDLATPAALDAELREVVAAARGGRLGQGHLRPANASLSNLGATGVDRFSALLTPPQASVLSVGAVRRRPVAIEGGLGVALCVELGLTVDHRVADGVHGGELLDRLTRALETPGTTGPLT